MVSVLRVLPHRRATPTTVTDARDRWRLMRAHPFLVLPLLGLACNVVDGPAPSPWVAKAPRPSPIAGPCITVANDRLVVFGAGPSGSLVMQAYDPVTDLW